MKPDPRSTAPSYTSSLFARRNAFLLTIRPSMWRVRSTKTWQASCSTWMFLPLPRACALWAWNGNIPFGEMIMMVWISLILLICAGFSAYAGASQLEQTKQHAKCSLDAFTKRRNGVSCICLSILFVILGVAINL